MSSFRIAFLIWLSFMLPLVAYLSVQSFTGEFTTPEAAPSHVKLRADAWCSFNAPPGTLPTIANLQKYCEIGDTPVQYR